MCFFCGFHANACLIRGCDESLWVLGYLFCPAQLGLFGMAVNAVHSAGV